MGGDKAFLCRWFLCTCSWCCKFAAWTEAIRPDAYSATAAK